MKEDRKDIYMGMGALDEIGKYYTPEIEELHVGFEGLQVKFDVDRGWSDFFITDVDDLKAFDVAAVASRVKHLDREDIESLGLSYDNNAEPYPAREYEEMLIPRAYAKDDWMLYHYEIDDVVWIENYKECSFFFKGTIKNKSELKRILKQIGI